MDKLKEVEELAKLIAIETSGKEKVNSYSIADLVIRLGYTRHSEKKEVIDCGCGMGTACLANNSWNGDITKSSYPEAPRPKEYEVYGTIDPKKDHCYIGVVTKEGYQWCDSCDSWHKVVPSSKEECELCHSKEHETLVIVITEMILQKASTT